jgi:glutamyl-tRNA synthetase
MSFSTGLLTVGLNKDHFEKILEICKGRMSCLSDWGDLTNHFFNSRIPLSKEELLMKEMDETQSCEILQIILWELEKLDSFSKENIYVLFKNLSEKLDIKLKYLTQPLYIAISGKAVSTPLFDTMEILGSDIIRMRIRCAMEELGSLSGKKLKKLEKKYNSLFDNI